MRPLVTMLAVLLLGMTGCFEAPGTDSLKQSASVPKISLAAAEQHDGGVDPGTHDGGWNGWHTCADKVSICHTPPGNPENRHMISISFCDWEDHMAHGDPHTAYGEPLPCP